MGAKKLVIYKMPKKFDLESALKFSVDMDKLTIDDEFILDHKNVKRVEPFGLLLIASKIRSISKKKNVKITGYKNNMSYAAHMGYFDSINIEYGKKIGQANGNDNYKPITKESINALNIKAFNKYGTDTLKYIEEEISKPLAKVLGRTDIRIINNLTFCISEIIRNVIEHSESNDFWFAAQYWPSRSLVEFSILDEGTGIGKSLQKNKKINFKSNKEALQLSINAGVTSSEKKKHKKIEDNSGFGLFMSSSICSRLGDFALCSGDACVIKKNKYMFTKNASFEGTIIRMRLNTNLINDIQKVKTESLAIGNKVAKELENEKNITLEIVKQINNEEEL